MMDLLQLVAYVTGFGFLSYLFFSALNFSFSGLVTSDKFKSLQAKKTEYLSQSLSTPNMLISLDKQLKELDLQVLPNRLGDFDKGVIQSIVDNSIVGKYEFINSCEDGGIYNVSINDTSYGELNNNYSVNENHNIVEVPNAISKMLLEEFESIAGRQALDNDHYYFKDHGVTAAKGIVLAAKKLVIKHNHVGDVKLDSGRTFKVSKNDLLIPIKNIENKFLSYLAVNGSNAKNVRVASSIKGGFFTIGEFPTNEKEYILCEDYLTGSTLHRSTNKTVLVCFDPQNIQIIAKSILFKDSEAKLIFATSKDTLTKNQSRIKKGLQYANDFNMPFIFPVFPIGKQYEQYKNWNELQKYKSDAEIKSLINSQIDYFFRVGKENAIKQVIKKFNVVYD